MAIIEVFDIIPKEIRNANLVLVHHVIVHKTLHDSGTGRLQAQLC